jgi:hypothetical protein
VRQIVLVTSNGLVEGLAIGEAAEVEALSPAILVQISGEVVVTARGRLALGQLNVDMLSRDVLSGQSGIFVSSSLEYV